MTVPQHNTLSVPWDAFDELAGLLGDVEGQFNLEAECANLRQQLEHEQAQETNQKLQARIAELERVVRKHHPMIAGHAIRLQQDGEDRAAAAWAEVAAEFNAVKGPDRHYGPIRKYPKKEKDDV
jgi:hypothetical protein